jgi:hypothetical protein
MHIIQSPLFDFEAFRLSAFLSEAFIKNNSHGRLVGVLEALPLEQLILALEKEHWTGRKGYSVREMLSALIAGLPYQRYSLAGVVRSLEHDKDTRMICGFILKNSAVIIYPVKML